MPEAIPGLAEFDWLAAQGITVFSQGGLGSAKGRQSLIPPPESHARGRPTGRIARHSREIIERALMDGITPLEVMLTLMREHWEHARMLHEQSGDFDKGAYHYSCAGGWADRAAPYFHPKLASIDMQATMTITHEAALDMLE